MKYPRIGLPLYVLVVFVASILGGWTVNALDGDAGGAFNVLASTQEYDCDEQEIAVNDSIFDFSYPVHNACVTYGQDIDMAYLYVYDEQGAYFQQGIRYKNSSVFVQLDIPGRAYLVPGTNTLVFDRGSRVSEIYVLDDADKALRARHGDGDYIYAYTLQDDMGERKVFPDFNVYPTRYVTHAVSANGRYIVADFAQYGVLRADAQRGTVTRVLDGTIDEQYRHVEAVSNDGRFALLGNKGLIVDMNNCGTALTLSGGSAGGALGNPCSTTDITTSIESSLPRGQRFYGINKAHFLEDNKLVFDARIWWENPTDPPQWREVVLPAPLADADEGSDSGRLAYLALGDSYSSGEGDVEGDGLWYQRGTEGQFKCHLSVRSYPYKLKMKWDIANGDMKSVACSGAKVDSDYIGDNEYMGQIGLLKSETAGSRQQIRSDALHNFTPGIVRQIDFVAKYKPEILTLTAGGNDVGFGEILSYCATPKIERNLLKGDISCAQAYDPQVAANLRKAIDDVRAPLTELVGAMREISPETKVYLVGYPQFVALDGCMNGSILLDYNERYMIRSSVSRINNILKLVARDTDVYYVDIESSLEGGQICQGSQYMTGPVRVASKILNGYTQEAYHPNAQGHEKIADTIYRRIKNDNLDYTIIDIPIEQNGQRVIKKAVTSGYVGVGSEQTVEMGPGTFNENGTVDVELFSQKIHLGTYKVAVDGSLSAEVTIPPEIETGVHLLTITGQSVEGDIVQVQQYITVEESPTGTNKAGNVSATRPVSADATSNELTYQTVGMQDESGSDDGLSQAIWRAHDNDHDKSNSRHSNPTLYTAGLASTIIILIGLGVVIYAKKAQKKAK